MDGQFAKFEGTSWLGSEEDFVGRDSHVWGDTLEMVRVDDVTGHHF
jgi:hypothetical protein